MFNVNYVLVNVFPLRVYVIPERKGRIYLHLRHKSAKNPVLK